MKSIYKNKIAGWAVAGLMLLSGAACTEERATLDLDGNCDVTAFGLDDMQGQISASAKTIVVTVPQDYDVSAMVVTELQISTGATCDIRLGETLNMLTKRTFTVTNGDAVQLWRLSVEEEVEYIEKPHALYVGLAKTWKELNIEEQTACAWLLDNVELAAYASLADIANGLVDLSECKIMWWHLHKDGGIDGKTAFESEAAVVLTASARLKGYFQNGGNFLLTRYATYLPAYLGEAAVYPNNCWGQAESDAETANEPWSFFATGHMDHPLFAGLTMNDGETERIYTCDAGYRITNSTAQWHIGSDWGGYANYDEWRVQTGAQDLAYGGDGAVVAWEYPATNGHGGIICIGSGCYDWYSVQEVAEYYHKNIASLTNNAINYLIK